MKKLLLYISVIFQTFIISCNDSSDSVVSTSNINTETDMNVIGTNDAQLGDIGDLFNGEPIGDPPVAQTFEEIDKWNKAVATNDDILAEEAKVSYFYLSNGDKIRITDFRESKWGKSFEFRVLNGEYKNKVAWGRVQDFRLIKTKVEQDKEAYERGE